MGRAGRILIVLALTALGLLVPSGAGADLRTNAWFDASWHYRVPVTIPSGVANHTGVVSLDFAAQLAAMNVGGTFDVLSPRITRGDGATLLGTQEYTDAVFGGATDAVGNARGELRFLLEGAGAGTYYVYFDVVENGAKPAYLGNRVNGNFEHVGGGGAALHWTPGQTSANGAQNQELHPTAFEGATVNLPAGCSDGATNGVANTPLTGSNHFLIGYRDNCEDGGGGARETIWIQRSIAVPAANPGNLQIFFRLQGFDDYRGNNRYDWLRIRAGAGATPPLVNHTTLGIPNGDNALFINTAGFGRRLAFGGGYQDQGWRTATLDLTPFAGQTINIRFESRFYTDDLYKDWVSLDDVEWSRVNGNAGTVEAFGVNIVDPADTGSGSPISVFDPGDAVRVEADTRVNVGAGQVTADLIDPLGNVVAAGVPLFDDGSNGDVTAGDRTWTNASVYTIQTSDPAGPGWIARVFARDSTGLARLPSGSAAPVDQSNYYNVDDQAFEVAVRIAGRVYLDIQPNSARDAAEDWTGGAAVFVNLVQAGIVVDTTSVVPGAGDYLFTNVGAGNYTVVVTDSAVNASPVQPTGYLFVDPSGGSHAISVGSVHFVDLDFGLFHGSRIEGAVFLDDGSGGGVANDGVRNGGEPGLGGVAIAVTDDLGATTWTAGTTDAAGSFVLWIPAAAGAGTLRLEENNPSGMRSTGGDPGTTGGTYDLAADRVEFTNVLGSVFSAVEFGDIRDNVFAPDGSQATSPGANVDYAHSFTAGSAGDVAFSLSRVTTPVAPAWSAALYRDLDCSATLDPGETVLSAPVTLAPGASVCILARVYVPANAPFNAQDQLTVTATFTYAGTSNQALDTVTDLTTVSGTNAAGLVLIKRVDKASVAPNELLVYTIEYTNGGGSAINNIEIFDSTPAFTTWESGACGAPLPPSLTACAVSVEPVIGSTGAVQWTLTGDLLPGQTGTVTYTVRVEP